MTKERAQALLNKIPCRLYRGEFVPVVAFRKTEHLLKNYTFTEKELDLLEQEIDFLKSSLGFKDAKN